MRIVALSDTHLHHRDLTVPDGDVLVHAGDFSNRGTFGDLRDFAEWFLDQPHRHKVFTPGNHDLVCEDNSLSYIKTIFPGVHVLYHETVVIDGVNFFGSPWSAEIYPGSPWSFSHPKSESSDFSARLWAQIPDGVDVLITHGPPYGVLDLVASAFKGEDPHVGDKNLLARVREINPKVHIFGHIHEQGGLSDYEYQTWFYNAAICDLAYRPVNPITVIDL